jgi:methyl-accepting chemotaxis protein
MSAITQSDPVQNEKKVIFVSLRTKLIVALALLFVVAFAAIFFWLENFVTGMAMTTVRNEILATAKTAAAGIDGDAHTALFESGKIDDPTYTQMASFLRSVKKTNPRASGMYTYIQLPNETDQVRLVVSAALPPGEQADTAAAQNLSECIQIPSSSRPELGEVYTWISPAMLDGTRIASVESELLPDEWGTWLSGYAPIYNSKGEPVGAVGVDMCAQNVILLQQSIRRSVLIALAISLFILIVMVWLLANGVTRPVLALTRVADRIGVGDYDLDFSNLHKERFHDEVDKLASVFELMVGKVYTREKDLRARVQQLEIMIDQGKRDREVQQIVESDFFQDLQGKVNEMRNRFKKEE